MNNYEQIPTKYQSFCSRIAKSVAVHISLKFVIQLGIHFISFYNIHTGPVLNTK